LQLIEALMATGWRRLGDRPVDVLALCEHDSRADRVKEVICEDPVEYRRVALRVQLLLLDRSQTVRSRCPDMNATVRFFSAHCFERSWANAECLEPVRPRQYSADLLVGQWQKNG
jgi:hypothetical protein